jgi:hypothetical protein
LTDQQAVWVREALLNPSKQTQMDLDFSKRFYSILARLELLASESVQTAGTAHFEAVKRELDRFAKAKPPGGKSFFETQR